MQVLQVLQLGRLDYGTALQLQQTLVELRKQGRILDTLLLLEHTPVITLGRNSRQANVVASPELLAERGIEVFETNRGGDVTFHGPGQLVGYPICDLRSLRPPGGGKVGAVDFVRRLEEVLIRVCADYGVAVQRIAGRTGVWTVPSRAGAQPQNANEGGNESQSGSESQSVSEGERKMAAIGIHISRGVTSHGFALNVTTDLEFFKLIVPCGIADKEVTSLERETGGNPPRPLDLDTLSSVVSRQFGNVFGVQVLWLESLDALLSGPPQPDAGPADDRLREPEEVRRLRQELEQAPRDDIHWA